ncbi:MAG: biopolymer transporter ExbD [Ignavibacteriae bacterium]|nr:biopolymer transporter ExbD [Ignavibacteriota bacterium]
MRFQVENKYLASFNFTSLTDVVMQLLIFFLLSSSFVMQPGIKVQVPKAETGESAKDKSVTITVTEKGLLFVNADRVSLETLGQALSAAMTNNRDRVVVINADKNVTLQNTVQVIDIAKAVGAIRFMIATQPVTVQ